MSSIRLAFSSEGAGSERTRPTVGRVLSDPPVRPLSLLRVGQRGVIVDVLRTAEPAGSRLDRLLALGVSPGASVTLLQRFPGVVFLCDQTELAIERAVAEGIFVSVDEVES